MKKKNIEHDESTGKDLGDFEGILHTGFASHFRAAGSGYSKTTYNPLKAFLPTHLAAWIPHIMRFWFHKRHAFRDYTTAGKGTGIFSIPSSATLSLVGDWGTGTDEARKVADCVQKFEPDVTIHLGDVYFVGDNTEVKEHFLGEKTSPSRPVAWPLGKIGSFALCGNHEMYALGNGYYNSILPKMGLRKSGEEWGAGQWASFFCLQNKYWRVIGLDTGYDGGGFDWGKMPIFEKSKRLRTSLLFKPKCVLPDPLLSWLQETVNPDADKRGLILLTHHGCYSAFSDWYQIPAKQLARIIHRPVIWFWGHEHKLAIYDRFHVPDGIEAHGRCIGHGGMPVERGQFPDLDCPWLAWDNRRYENGENINVGFNGHVNLSLDGPELRAVYLDLDGARLFTEDWRVNLESGALEGPKLKKIMDHPSLHFREISRE